jgi:xanthine dehydrogenase iron-sulfur cluster and FAD-binding subunit A
VRCGFCTPGVVMSLQELLATDPTPSETQVRARLAGNLRRCTGYNSYHCGRRGATLQVYYGLRDGGRR